MLSTGNQLIAAARELSKQVGCLKFRRPVTHVYNPLAYAGMAHEEYLRRFGGSRKRVVFLGMNPGPFGMVQTGVPFGEITAVREWMKLCVPIRRPVLEHPKRPILGLDCPRSEVSGRRLWKLFADRFGDPEKFFREHFVANYCPLAFCEITGRNRTPDKLSQAEQIRVFKACDAHLRGILEILRPEWLIGIGAFAAGHGRLISDEMKIQCGVILHPSPASPAANRDWAGKATRQLVALGVWK